jgi:hypothetical protein
MKFELKRRKNMKVIMKRSAFVIAIVVLCALTVSAGNKNRIATAGAQELLIPVGARGIAMGGSTLASITGADAIFFNPAGVARSSSNVDAFFSSMNSIGDINVSYAAVAMKAGSLGSLALSMKSLGFGEIPVTTEFFPDGTGETYSPSFVNIGLTYSSLLSDRVSVGATATIVSEKIMSTSATGIAFNVGIQYAGLGLPGLNLGVAIKNVGTQMKYDGSNLQHPGTINDAQRNSNPNWYAINVTSFDLPTSIEIGLAYTQKIGERNALTVAGDFQNNNFSDDEYKLGAEFMFEKTLFIRGGYMLAPEADKDPAGETSYIYGLSYGVGLVLNLGDIEARVDYGYRSVKYFSGNNVFTVSLGL